MCNKPTALPAVHLHTATHEVTVQIVVEPDAITLKLGGHCGVTVAQLRLADNGEVVVWTWKVSEAETAAEVVVGMGQAKVKE